MPRKSQSSVVRKMVRAVVTGWREALANQKKAVDVVLAKDGKLNRVHETKMIEWVARLTHAKDIDGKIGTMSTEKWKNMIELWREFGGITADISPADCFEPKFVNELY